MAAAASMHTHKYSNVSNPSSEPSQEPIYQNQAELGLLKEPIYQNLPAHDKLIIMQQPMSSSSGQPTGHEEMNNAKSGHVSRVAITNSREDLSQHTEYIQPQEDLSVSEVDDKELRKKSVTKINIVATDDNEDNDDKVDSHDSIEPVTKSPPKKPARMKTPNFGNSQSVENIMAISDDSHLNLTPMTMTMTTTPSSNSSKTSNTPRTPSSKPRAGRKRWAFNFGGSKTGSLKSLKSLKSTGNPSDITGEDEGHKK